MTGDRLCRHLRQLPDPQRSIGACRIQLLTGRIVSQSGQSAGMSLQQSLSHTIGSLPQSNLARRIAAGDFDSSRIERDS